MVTGGAGFIGSHIVDALVESGHRVSVVDDLSTGKFENINLRVNFYRLAVQSADFSEAVAGERPDVIIHQASQVDVQRSLKDPLGDAETNIIGVINLLEACRRYKVSKVIYASTAAVYGAPVALPLDENSPVAPQSPYGASKLAAESYFKIYSAIYGISYTVLRYANVYGPRQDATGEGGVVAIFVDRLLRGESLHIFGDGRQTRDFVFVKDVVAANLVALNRGSGKTLNISTGAGLSINNLFRVLQSITGSPQEPVYRTPRPGDIAHSCLSNEKARQVLGWCPRYSLEKGLQKTVDFTAYKHKPF